MIMNDLTSRAVRDVMVTHVLPVGDCIVLRERRAATQSGRLEVKGLECLGRPNNNITVSTVKITGYFI